MNVLVWDEGGERGGSNAQLNESWLSLEFEYIGPGHLRLITNECSSVSSGSSCH